MSKNERITPEGTQDLLFEACAARRLVEGRLQHLFAGRGFQEVMTPGLEFYDVFARAPQYFPQESMYKLTDNKGRLLVMRPDTTLPIARLTATKLQDYSLPIRLYYSQSVYRMGILMNGGSHEIRQMGVELLGAAEGKADLEILALGAQSLADCGVADYRLELGHIGIFKVLMERLAASLAEKEAIAGSIENKNYSALDALLQTLAPSAEAALLQELPHLFGGAEIFAQSKALFAAYDDGRLVQAVEDVEAIYRTLDKLGLANKIIVDFGLVGQADYYTGVIFRGYIEEAGAPVLSGGRYDGLLGEFGRQMPAIGFAVQIDLIADVLLRQQSFRSQAEVLVYAEDAFVPQSLAFMQSLDRQGVRSEYCLAESAAEARDYARAKGIRELYIVGEKVEKIEVQL